MKWQQARELFPNQWLLVLIISYRELGSKKDGHVWLDALAKRNFTIHTYDKLAEKLVNDIKTEF